jgi:sulfur relay (sulfurtransferase) DsrF/TusC family protein
MTPHVLFIITSDPRKSAKPAEAIRIAAGVSAWKKTHVSVYLRDAAVLALNEDPSDLINEDNYTRYLPMLAELGEPIYVEKSNPHLAELGDSPVKSEPITDKALAELAAKQTYVFRF